MWIFKYDRDYYWVGYLVISLNGSQRFEAILRCESKEDAMTKCHYLNGGN